MPIAATDTSNLPLSGSLDPAYGAQALRENKGMQKTALLGRIGKNLSGGAIGVVIARFVLWCSESNFIPVLDFRGVESLGLDVVTSACLYYSSSNGNFVPVKVEYCMDEFLKNPDAALYLCQELSA